jgi:endonuclease-8
MPEGPSLVMFREDFLSFKGKKVVEASGNAKAIDHYRMKGRTLKDIRTFGKHTLFCFGEDLTLRIHFLMFGTYRIDEVKESRPEVIHLKFKGGKELNFYTCSVRYIEQPLDTIYDWASDVLNPAWDPRKALKKLKALPPDLMAGDVLLDQDIFAGVGNIIKNEVLYITGIRPMSSIGHLPLKKQKELIKVAVEYTCDFLKWRREGTLRSHWQVHRQKLCPIHGTKLCKEHIGEKQRQSYWCETCQMQY